MKKYATTPMVFRMPPEMHEQVIATADDNMVSASAVCRQAIAEYLKNIKEENMGGSMINADLLNYDLEAAG